MVIGFGLVALAACSNAAAGPSTAAAPGSTPTAAPPATAAPTVAVTASPTKALPSVDLVLSGDFAVVAKGTAGQCTLGTDSAGNVAFRFGAVEADYPGLAQGLYVWEGDGAS